MLVSATLKFCLKSKLWLSRLVGNEIQATNREHAEGSALEKLMADLGSDGCSPVGSYGNNCVSKTKRGGGSVSTLGLLSF